MDKSKLTIQRPEGCPEWAEIGVMVMGKDKTNDQWKGPFILLGLFGFELTDYFFRTSGGAFKYAKPYIKWQPEPGEWCAFWNGDMTYFSVAKFHNSRLNGGGFKQFCLLNGMIWNHIARLVDDDGHLIDLRCTVEELKEMTAWL
jgi:hypothetical protein